MRVTTEDSYLVLVGVLVSDIAMFVLKIDVKLQLTFSWVRICPRKWRLAVVNVYVHSIDRKSAIESLRP